LFKKIGATGRFLPLQFLVFSQNAKSKVCGHYVSWLTDLGSCLTAVEENTKLCETGLGRVGTTAQKKVKGKVSWEALSASEIGSHNLGELSIEWMKNPYGVHLFLCKRNNHVMGGSNLEILQSIHSNCRLQLIPKFYKGNTLVTRYHADFFEPRKLLE